MTQITPLSNPSDNTKKIVNGDFNQEIYNNLGVLEVPEGVSFSNQGTINNNQTARFNVFGMFDNGAGSTLNNEFNAFFNNSNSFTNEGLINNSGQLNAQSLSNNKDGVVYNYSGVDPNGVISLGGYSTNSGTITNYGIINIGSVLYNSGIINGTGVLNGRVIGDGTFSPGASAGGMLVDGDLTLQDGSIKSIELSGDSDQARNRVDTDHDFIDITGDLVGDGSSNISGVSSVTASGKMFAQNFTTTSDENLKENIAEIPDALSKVEAIRGVTFDWKDGSGSTAGVIAQDVEAILPSIVVNGEHKAVDYNGVIGLLVRAVKELSAEVKELKSH